MNGRPRVSSWPARCSDVRCVAQIDGGVPDARGTCRLPDQLLRVHAHRDPVERALIIEYQNACARVCRALKVDGEGLAFRNEADHDGQKFALATFGALERTFDFNTNVSGK